MPTSADSQYVYRRAVDRRVLSAAAALLITIIAAAFLGEYQARSTFEWIRHTVVVQLEAAKLLSLVEDLETSQRGFLLTGEDTHLELYRASLPKIPTAIKKLTELTTDNPAQQARLQRLEHAINARIAQLEQNTSLRRAQDIEGLTSRIRSGIGLSVMQRVRETIAEIANEEEKLLQSRESSYEQISRLARIIEVAGLVTLIAVAYYVMKQTQSAQIARRMAFEAQEKAVEAAHAASRSKSEFLASMSHEIRTPLNGVIGNIELLARSGITPDQEALLFDAEKAAKSLLALVGNVLDFSKIESGKLTIENVEMAPAALLQEAVDILQSRARQNNLFISVSFGTDVPATVKGDPTRLRQILLNIIGNAVKFTLQGGIHAHLEATDHEHGHALLRFHIHDSGRGFDQATTDKLFQPFVQEEKHLSDQAEGTGLGLSISKNLVEAFGGTMSCESVPGNGASFFFSLPVEVVKPSLPPPPAELAGRAVMFINGAGMQPPHLAEYFRSRGARIVEANTREAALALARGSNGEQLLDFAIYVDNVSASSPWPPISFASELRDHHTALAIYSPTRTSALFRRALATGASLLLDEKTTPSFLDRNTDYIFGLGTRRTQGPPLHNASVANTSILKGRHVLVLEDRLVNQTVIQRQLKSLNMTCSIVADGIAGLDAVAVGHFDVILCDCSMPRMNGYDFTRALREREKEQGSPRTPVIAMTANAFREDMEKCFASGMDDFVSKPVTLDRLAAALAHWMAKAPA